MRDSDPFTAILKVPGVDQYLLADRDAKILSQRIAEPEKMARIVSFCGLRASAIGKTNFRYLAVSRETRDHFFIFPVGKYYLGVIKQKDISNAVLVENILQFLKDNFNR
nr:roadblock/LC7 domain-containing protein [Desulfobacula sp.]